MNDLYGSLDEKKKKRKKAGTESGKESSLRDWFGRKGAKGSKKGWVDCNSPDGNGGYKACLYVVSSLVGCADTFHLVAVSGDARCFKKDRSSHQVVAWTYPLQFRGPSAYLAMRLEPDWGFAQDDAATASTQRDHTVLAVRLNTSPGTVRICRAQFEEFNLTLI